MTFRVRIYDSLRYLKARRRVQSGSGLVEKHDWGVVDQLEGDGQPFPLSAAEHGGPGVDGLGEAQGLQDLPHGLSLLLGGLVAADLQVGRYLHRLAHRQVRRQAVVAAIKDIMSYELPSVRRLSSV